MQHHKCPADLQARNQNEDTTKIQQKGVANHSLARSSMLDVEPTAHQAKGGGLHAVWRCLPVSCVMCHVP